MGARAHLSAISSRWTGLVHPYWRQIEPFFEQRSLDVKRRLTAGQARATLTFNLRALNDTLAKSEFRDKYWLIGGLLIGWAREKNLLDHDLWDADFAYLHQDRTAFESAGHLLLQHGFRFKQHWYNNAGLRTQSIFVKDNAKFEFWGMMPNAPLLEYFMYGTRNGAILEAHCAVSAHALEPISFLDRTWFKPADHGLYLTEVFGDWRVPQMNYDYMRDQHDIITVCRWQGHWAKRFTSDETIESDKVTA